MSWWVVRHDGRVPREVHVPVIRLVNSTESLQAYSLPRQRGEMQETEHLNPPNRQNGRKLAWKGKFHHDPRPHTLLNLPVARLRQRVTSMLKILRLTFATAKLTSTIKRSAMNPSISTRMHGACTSVQDETMRGKERQYSGNKHANGRQCR
jgi:hypothetical protein